jgi:hypothetical protein
MTPLQPAAFLSHDTSEDDPIMMTDTMRRLGRLETGMNEILPVLGKVSESVANQGLAIEDIKSNVKEIVDYFTAMRVDCAGCKVKISELETRNHDYATDKMLALQDAKEKAEAQVDEKLKELNDKRNNMLKLIGGGVATVVTTAVVTWLGLK